MKEITIKVYPYEELNDKAKERALADWNENNNDPFMQSHMINLLGEELDERGIKYGKHYTAQDPDVRYSLSHCQGDGFMFVGEFEFKGYLVRVSHSDPHYYHKYTAQMDWPEFVGEEKEAEEEKIAEEWLEIYRAICDEMEEKGYQHIEWITSEEHFAEECEANEWMFEANGEMRNV